MTDMEFNAVNEDDVDDSKDINKESYCIIPIPSYSKPGRPDLWGNKEGFPSMTIRDSLRVMFNMKSIQEIRKNQIDIRNPNIEKTKQSELLEYINNIITNCDEDEPPSEINMFQRKQIDTILINNRIYLSNEMTREQKEELYMLSLVLDTNESGFALNEISETAEVPTHRKFLKQEKSPTENELINILEITEEQEKSLKRKYQHLQENSNIFVNISHAQNLKITQTVDVSNFYYLMDIVSMEELENEKFTLNERAAEATHKATLVSNTYNPKWNESLTLPHKEGHYLCVEVWNHVTEKKGLLNFKLKKIDELVGRSLVPLNNLRDLKNKRLDLLSHTGKSIKGNIVLSITKDMDIPILKLSDCNKYIFFQQFIVKVASRDTEQTEGVKFGKLGGTMETFSRKLASRLKLSEFQICAAHWAYSSSIPKLSKFKLEINYNLVTLDSAWESEHKRLPPDILRSLIKTIQYYYKREVDTVKKLLFLIPPNSEDCEQEVSELLDIISKWYDFLKKRNATNPDDMGVANEVIQKISEGIEVWYKRIANFCEISEGNLIKQAKGFCLLSRYILAGIKMVKKGYQKSFAYLDINYQVNFSMVIDPLFCMDVQSFVQNVRSDEVVHQKENKNHLSFQIFNLYCKIRLICLEIKSFAISEQRSKIKILGNEEWFRHFFKSWFDVLQKTTHEGVQKAIEIDEDFEKENLGMLISTSAIDISVCLAPNYFFYDKLKTWSESIEKIHGAVQIALLVSEILTDYIKHMGEKMKQTTKDIKYSLSTPFLIDVKMCRILNNTYFAKEYLRESPRRMGWELLKQTMANLNMKTDDIVNKTVKNGLEDITQKEFELTDIIGVHFKKQLKLFYDMYLESHHGKNAKEAINPLIDWLSAIVKNLRKYLAEELFLQILQVLWYLILDVYISFMNNDCYGKKTEMSIHQSLEIIYDFVHNKGCGIIEDLSYGSKYKIVYDYFSAYTKTSEELIGYYGRKLAEKTKDEKNNNIGSSLTFSIVYYERQEFFEINIIELNSQYFPGKVNSYIEASFLPPNGTREVRTGTVKYQNNINIDEMLKLRASKEVVDSGIIIELAVNHISLPQNERLGGVIYINSADVGRGSFNLEDIISRESIYKAGKLLKMNFIFPGINNSYLLTILKGRDDSAAVKFIDKLNKLIKTGQYLTTKTSNKNFAQAKGGIVTLVQKLL